MVIGLEELSWRTDTSFANFMLKFDLDYSAHCDTFVRVV